MHQFYREHDIASLQRLCFRGEHFPEQAMTVQELMEAQRLVRRAPIGDSVVEAILSLATIAQRWRLALVPGQKIELQPKITLRPKNGIRVVPVPRES